MEFLSGFLIGVGGSGIACLLMLAGGINALSARLKAMESAVEGAANRSNYASEWWKDGTVEGDWS